MEQARVDGCYIYIYIYILISDVFEDDTIELKKEFIVPLFFLFLSLLLPFSDDLSLYVFLQ